MSRWIWVSWESQRRNHTLSKALGAELFQFDISLNRVMRYFLSLSLTISTFFRERPTLIFVQNPSLILAFFSVYYGRVFKVPVVVDAHNAGLFPLDGRSSGLNKIALRIIKNTPLTIVSNEKLKMYVDQVGGISYVLADPIPEFHCPLKKKYLKGDINILFICTYASDEPYVEVVRAARELDKSICIYISGRSKGKEGEFLHMKPKNVVLTGYLPEEDYIQLLYNVEVVIDLTTRENCLVCGGYEAVAAEKPLITSDSKALRDCFYKGTLFTNNTALDLAKKITCAIDKGKQLREEMAELKKEKIANWILKKEMLDKNLRRIESLF